MLRCVIQYHFPYESITCLASSRSKGKILEQDGMQFVVEELTAESFNDIDVAFFSAGGSISKEFVPIAVSHGVVCIDNTSYFRMHKGRSTGCSRSQCRRSQMASWHHRQSKLLNHSNG